MTPNAKATIINAAHHSREIGDEIQLAILLLMGGQHGEYLQTNGYGVLRDPNTDIVALMSARAAIDRAITLHGQTRWPTDTDYDNA